MLAYLGPGPHRRSREPSHPPCGLQNAVRKVAKRGREPAVERRLEALDPFGREARSDDRLVFRSELVALLPVDRDPQGSDTPERVTCEGLDRVERALRSRPSLPWRRLADQRGSGVERRGHAPQREPAVSSTRPAGHLPRVVHAHPLPCLGQPQSRRAARHSGADDDDIGIAHDRDGSGRRGSLSQYDVTGGSYMRAAPAVGPPQGNPPASA